MNQKKNRYTKNDNEIWKEHFMQNPEMLSYGKEKQR